MYISKHGQCIYVHTHIVSVRSGTKLTLLVPELAIFFSASSRTRIFSKLPVPELAEKKMVSFGTSKKPIASSGTSTVSSGTGRKENAKCVKIVCSGTNIDATGK